MNNVSQKKAENMDNYFRQKKMNMARGAYSVLLMNFLRSKCNFDSQINQEESKIKLNIIRHSQGLQKESYVLQFLHNTVWLK